MRRHRHVPPLALLLVPLLANLPLHAQDAKLQPAPTKFLRFVEEGRVRPATRVSNHANAHPTGRREPLVTSPARECRGPCCR